MGSYEYRDNLGNPRDYYDIVNDAAKLCEEIEEKDKEIERLKKELKSIKENYKIQLEYDKQLETKNNKAREMIKFIAYNSERPLTMTELNKVYNILGSDE